MTTFERRLSTHDPREGVPNPDSADRTDRDGERQTIRYVLIGPRGATQFVYWRLTGSSAARHAEIDGKFPIPNYHDGPDGDGGYLEAIDLGFHARAPMRWQNEGDGRECEYVGRCYYDGSGLNAQRVLGVLLSDGPEAVWRELEDYYVRVFETPDEEKTINDVGFGQLINATFGRGETESLTTPRRQDEEEK